jgi:DNA-binding NarL/FixJ family response regulator
MRVLIADDQPSFTEVVRAMLEPEPEIEVVGAAPDGERAVELAQALRPNVVVMDISMPRVDGIEATRRILGEAPETQVLMLTGSDAPEDFERAQAAGAAAYVTKERIASELVPTLLSLVRQPETR